MKQIIESFVTVFLVILSVLIFVQFIGASMQIRGARQFHTACIGEIESSDFDTRVIEDCKEQARENGYTLEVVNQREEQLICAECNTVAEEGDAICAGCGGNALVYLTGRLCEVKMNYEIEMALIHLKKGGVLYGYAR